MIRILAPAKLNLGLEILGRRPDGFHEVRTIYCAVSLFDHVRLDAATESSVTCSPNDGIGQNLALEALQLALADDPTHRPARIEITKRIPIAAGLGGASSDAAATLLALARSRGLSWGGSGIADHALRCGSDVPFFLRSGIAIGSGRGDVLEHIEFQPVHAVIVTPRGTVPDKTRTMYGLIQQSDWTDGTQVAGLAAKLNDGSRLDPCEPLPNAFRRPLYDLFPDVGDMAARIESVVGLPVQVSGAGPSLYVLCANAAEAQRHRRSIQSAIDVTAAATYCVRSVSRVLMSESPDE